MNIKELSNLTDQELAAEAKKNRLNSIINGVLFGMLIGIAIFSTVKNGLGFFTFFPLFFAYFIFNNSKISKAVKKEWKSRNF